MKILDTLKKTGAAVEAEGSDLGLLLKNAAVAAITGGIESDAWKTYMRVFADNPAQFERLTVPKADDQNWLRESRAYMVANATCGGITTTQTQQFVDENIDANIDDSVDEDFVATKELSIP